MNRMLSTLTVLQLTEESAARAAALPGLESAAWAATDSVAHDLIDDGERQQASKLLGSENLESVDAILVTMPWYRAAHAACTAYLEARDALGTLQAELSERGGVAA
jgi:hypothetical protein